MELFTNEWKIFSDIYAIFRRIAFFIAIILMSFPVINKVCLKYKYNYESKNVARRVFIEYKKFKRGS